MKSSWLDLKALNGAPYWIAAVVVGLVAVTYSTAFNGCIAFSSWVAPQHPYFFMALSPACFLLGSWIVIRFAPGAGGAGIANITTAIDMPITGSRDEIERFVSLRVAIIVIASSLLCVLGGGALGREGPMVQIAACLFYFVGRRFKDVWPFEEHRSWIIAGGAAGVAAAFQTPLAGIIFVIEELAHQHFRQFKTYVISAVVISGMIAQWLFGRYLFLGYAKVETVPFNSVGWALGLGMVCGVGASCFELTRRITSRRTSIFFSNKRLYIALFSSAVVVAIALLVDSRSIGGGIGLVEELLFDPTARADWKLIAARFFGTIFTHLSGCAGGFLAPSLALGAAIGSWFAVITKYHSHNLVVLLGMAAFLGAITRAPFTALVIVMEMTDSHAAIFPLMVACLASNATESFLTGRFRKL